MKRYRIIFVAATIAMLATILPVGAETETDTTASREGVYTLGEIVVSGRQDGVENVSTINTITSEDINNIGAQNLVDVLKTIPGINVRMGGAGTPRIDIRGFRTRHVLLLLDGIPINDTYDGQFDPTSFPVEHIAEVKVVTGGGSVLYGPGGSGGVINIITKKGIKGIHGSVSGEAGSESASLAKATLSGGTEDLDYFVSGYTESQDAFPLSDDFEETDDEDGSARENSDHERNNLFANMGYDWSDQTKMGLTLNWYDGEDGVPPNTIDDNSDPFAKKLKYDRIDDLEGLSAQAAFSHEMDNPFALKGWVYMNTLDMLENRYDDDTYTAQEKKGASSSDSTTQIVGFNTQVLYEYSDTARVTLGLISEKHEWEASGFQVGNSSTTYFDEDKDIKIQSVALEYEVSPADSNMNVVLGIGQHYMDGSDIDSASATSFLAGVNFNLTDATRLWTSWAKKVRFPSLRQLYDVDSGNTELESEITSKCEVGLAQEMPADTSVTISAFFSDVEDYIEKNANESGDEIYQNWEEYLFKGVDLSIENRWIDNLLLRASYSYLYTADRSDNTDKDELQHRPRNKYYAEATYTFGFGLMLHADVLRVTHQYYYDSDGTDPLLKAKLNDYTVWGMKISQRLLDDSLEIYVRAKNAFDKDYEQSYGLPQAGQTIYGGFDYSF